MSFSSIESTVASSLCNPSMNNHSSQPRQQSSQSSSSVQVAVRIRPFLPNEPSQRCIHIVPSSSTTSSSSRSSSSCTVQIGNESMSSPGGSVTSYGVHKSFVFDQAFPPETKQKHIFQQCIEPLVGACLSGYNATVLAYGQTGSGKTYTILGPSTEGIFAEDGVSASQAGVIPRALRDLFDKLEAFKKQRRSSCDGVVGSMSEGGGSNSIKRSENPYQYEVRVQYLELYGEEIRDLLNSSGNKLVIRDGGGGVEPEVIGASEVKVNSAEEALLCLMRGTLRRVTGATAMNSESSRSHAIMTVIVEQTTVMRPGSAGSVMSAGSDRSSGNTDIETKRSKFHFVDLAGSERQKRSLAQGQRLKEGIDINKGLLVLGNVISALGDPKKQGKVFVPYRDSKLTRLLKGSLGGNHKTLMIACVSPSSINLEESLNCLRYANRAKNIQNNAIINLDAGSKLVAELRSQIQALARELLEYQEKSGDDSSKVFKIDVLRALANGVDSSNMNFGSANGMSNSYPSQKVEVDEEIIMRFKAEIEKLKSVTKQLEQDLAIQSEELFAARAETEYYRLMRQEGGSDEQMSAEEVRGKESFVNRVKDYEREVANLRNQLRDIRAQSALSVHSSPSQRGSELNIAPSSPSRSSSYNNDSPATPKSGRNRSLIKVSSPFPTTDKDDEEDKEIQKITQKYLKVGQQEVGVIDDEEDEEDVDNKVVNGTIDEEDEEETFTSRQSIISSHVVQLTRGIAAKQELITKLEQSQLKYERMKSFYQEKLRKMTLQLTIQEAEKATLEAELKKSEKDSQKYKELEQQLIAKQKHISELKKRQKEVKNLTSIASRNEAIILKLSSEIESMKKQKTSLEQQLAKERKEHNRSLQQWKKKAQTREKDVIMMRQQLAATIAQKEKVQGIAKSHAKEILELRSKYNTAEKKLRMQTLKRGMMEKAGIDPILVGRMQVRGTRSSCAKLQNTSSTDVQKMRIFLDEKIAEIGRKEVVADKLAQEWEDHLELTTRKEQILADSKGKLKRSGFTDEIEALEFQIEYKESRIRSLAAKLATKSSGPDENDSKGQHKDVLLDDGVFKNITSGLHPLAASQLASKVLFGMVVKEKRRVATLARAASTLDQKAVSAEKLLAEKEAALRTLIEESKNERLAMAQSQQDRILSLMEIVQGEDDGVSTGENLSPTRSVQHSESLVLRMANERIEALESQLADLRREKEIRENNAAMEAEKLADLTKITKDYSSLIEKSKTMRQSLLKIRDSISMSNRNPESNSLVKINAIVNKTLKSLDEPIDSSRKSPISRDLASPFEDLDSDTENESEFPDWADHILKDLAIIAAGDVPPSLKVGGGQSSSSTHGLPRTPRGSTLDRVSSSTKNMNGHNYERLSDSESVRSKSNSRNGERPHSTNRPRYPTPKITRQRSSSTPRRSYRSPSPMRQRSPLHSETRLTDRISAILKDGPPRVLTLPDTPDFDDRSIQSFRSTGSRSHARSSQRSIPGESTFVKAYTKKDVFERLQKKHTNSYTLNLQASQSFERNS